MAVLAEQHALRSQWTSERERCELFVPKAASNGFDIRFAVETEAVTVNWGNWHSRFEPTEGNDVLVEYLFGLLRDMVSCDMRVRELWAGGTPYRGYLETCQGEDWLIEQEMGLIFWNYFGRRTVKIFTNAILPGRMRETRNGA
ncbi:MAG: hypothetical protein AB7H53_18785 [Hyphomicrobium sp.]